MAKSGVSRAGSPSAGPRLLPLVLGFVLIVAVAAIFWRPRSEGSDGVAERPQGGAVSSNSEAQDNPNNDQGTSGGGNAADNAADSSIPTKLHENGSGGYSFRYPRDWELEQQGSVTRVARPDRHFIVSFGLGPLGGLPVAYDEFVALLGDSYENVTVHNVDATKVKGHVGVLVRGAATAPGGVRVRLRAAVLSGNDSQRAIGALAATDLRGDPWPPSVLNMLESLEPGGGVSSPRQ